ncbi:hypothetical protein GQ607_008750 [Colletotrichum asianum]|uniref:Uncharacterized protein n=1 Tax=Colletotrichum asianum TaxID=702518 RepID=A0A8H3WCX6_9PEZI|nr:hypothetical protein GQ607_008750 [Colletotrichum asianum]
MFEANGSRKCRLSTWPVSQAPRSRCQKSFPTFQLGLHNPPHKHHTTTSPPARSNLIFLFRRKEIIPNLTPPNSPPAETCPSCSPEAPSSRPPSTSRVCCLTLTARSTGTNALNGSMPCVHLVDRSPVSVIPSKVHAATARRIHFPNPHQATQASGSPRQAA